jgi:thiol-disulfide isomerase/thioredoxin
MLAMLLPACGTSPEPPPVTELRASEVPGLARQQKGTVTLVNVWASWCDPCKEELPDVIRLKNAYDPRGLKVVLLSADDREDVDSLVRPFLASLGIDFPSYVSGDSTDDLFIAGMSPNWNGALPATFLYDDAGQLREMFVGKQTYDTFRDAVEHLLPR